MFVMMVDTTYMVDELLFLLAMVWACEVLVLYVTMAYAIH
jgi:hypothetical protein